MCSELSEMKLQQEDIKIMTPEKHLEILEVIIIYFIKYTLCCFYFFFSYQIYYEYIIIFNAKTIIYVNQI
jgi:hypothetical protein